MIQQAWEQLGLIVPLVLAFASVALTIFFYYRPRFILLAYFALFPAERLYISMYAFNIRADDALIVIGAAAVLLRFGLKPIQNRSPAFRRILLVLLVLQAYRYGSMLTGLVTGYVNYYLALTALHSLLQIYVFIVVVRSDEDLDWLSSRYFWIVAAWLVYFLPDLAANPFVQEVGRYRVKAAFSEAEEGGFNPNAFGIMASMTNMLGFYLLYTRGRLKYLPGVAVGIIICMMFFFRSALFVSVMTILICASVDFFVRPRISFIIAGILAIVLYLSVSGHYSGNLEMYMSNIDVEDLGLRTQARAVGLSIFRDNWLTGLGMGQSFHEIQKISNGLMGSIHNSYVISMAEFGIIGFGCLITFFIMVGAGLVRWALKEREGWFWTAMYLAFLVRIYFGPNLWYSKMTMQHFSFVIAALGMYLDRADGVLENYEEDASASRIRPAALPSP
ncbi:MAG: O-antigen ligase family protein [Deltaproteobacteria bacterium]|nr:O-antigen ligase family protein [Deltaproteobacteria bacterium]